MKLRASLLRNVSAVLLFALSWPALAETTYQKPSQAVLGVLHAPSTPSVFVSPRHDAMILATSVPYPSIAYVAEPKAPFDDTPTEVARIRDRVDFIDWGERPGLAAGLYHLAILYPTRAELADAFVRLTRAGISLEGAADHGVSEALYLRDPDGNGVELYWDRPQKQWPRPTDGGLAMFTRPLDLDGLATEAKH